MKNIYFFTGFPGFIASSLIRRMAQLDYLAGHIYLLVLPAMRQKAEAEIGEICKGAENIAKEQFTVIEGDITKEGLSIEGGMRFKLAEEVTHVFHLAAIYDLAVKRDIAWRVNVTGTENVNQWVKTLKALKRYVYFSIAYVSGKREGRIYEHELELFAGILLALMPFVALYALPIMIFNDTIMPWEWTTPFLVFLPGTEGYLAMTYKMIDLSFIINRLHYYCLMSLMITSVILTGILVLDPGKLPGDIFGIARLALFIFTVLLLFLYIKDYVEYRLRKIMFPKRQDSQMSLNRFLQWMKSEHKLDNLAFILKREIENCLPAKEVTLVKVDQKGEAISLLDNRKVSVARYHWLANESTERLQADAHGFKMNLYHDKSGTIFLYGRWKMRRKLNPDEKIWLETLLNYAQVVIENQNKAEDLIGLLSLEKGRYLLPHTVKKQFSIFQSANAGNCQGICTIRSYKRCWHWRGMLI